MFTRSKIGLDENKKAEAGSK